MARARSLARSAACSGGRRIFTYNPLYCNNLRLFMKSLHSPQRFHGTSIIMKRPKIYFRDSRILHALLESTTREELLVHPKLGASWEGFALAGLLDSKATEPSGFSARLLTSGTRVSDPWPWSGSCGTRFLGICMRRLLPPWLEAALLRGPA